MLQNLHSNAADGAGSSLAVNNPDICSLYISHYLTSCQTAGLISTAENAVYSQHNNLLAGLNKLGKHIYNHANRRLRGHRQLAGFFHHLKHLCQRTLAVNPFMIAMTQNQTHYMTARIIL